MFSLKKAGWLGKIKPNRAFLIIIAVFLLLKIPFLFKYPLIWWDGAVFIGIGKYIYSSGAVGLWEPARPLALSLILGAAWRLGLDVPLFSRVLELVFSSGILILVYLIGKRLFSKKAALIAAFLLAFTPLFFFHSTKVYSGIPSTFFALLALYFFIDKKNISAGIFAGLAFMFRFPQAVLLIALLAAIFLNMEKLKAKAKSALQISIAFFLVTLPFLIFNIFMYQGINIILAALYPFIAGATHPSEAIYKVTNPFSYYFVALFRQNPLFLFALPALFFVFKERKSKTLPIITAFFLVFFIVFAGKLERFSLIFLPYICLLAALGIYEIFIKKLRGFKTPHFSAVFVILLRKQKYVSRKTAYAVFFLYAAASCVFVASQDIRFYSQESFAEPAVVSEFYTSDSLLNANGYILTTDPVPVAYIDKKFIHYYETPWEAERVYSEYGENAAAVIYTPHFFPCEKLGSDCEETKTELFKRIQQEKELVLYKNYSGLEYYIFT